MGYFQAACVRTRARVNIPYSSLINYRIDSLLLRARFRSAFSKAPLKNAGERVSVATAISRPGGRTGGARGEGEKIVMAYPRRRLPRARRFTFSFSPISIFEVCFHTWGNGAVLPTRKRQIRRYRIRNIEKNMRTRYRRSIRGRALVAPNLSSKNITKENACRAQRCANNYARIVTVRLALFPAFTIKPVIYYNIGKYYS